MCEHTKDAFYNRLWIAILEVGVQTTNALGTSFCIGQSYHAQRHSLYEHMGKSPTYVYRPYLYWRVCRSL